MVPYNRECSIFWPIIFFMHREADLLYSTWSRLLFFLGILIIRPFVTLLLLIIYFTGWIFNLWIILLFRAGKIFFGPQGKRKLATPLLQIMILKLSPPRCVISKESVQQKWIDELWFRKQLSTCLFVTGPGALSRLTPLSVGLLLLPCTLMDILSLFTRFCSWKQVTGHDPFVAKVGKQTLMMKTVT